MTTYNNIYNQKQSVDARYEAMNKLAEKQGYVKLAEIGKLFNVSQNYLNVLIHRKKIEGKKFGRNWYSTKKSVDNYLKKQRLTVILPTPASYRRKFSKPVSILPEEIIPVKSESPVSESIEKTLEDTKKIIENQEKISENFVKKLDEEKGFFEALVNKLNNIDKKAEAFVSHSEKPHETLNPEEREFLKTGVRGFFYKFKKFNKISEKNLTGKKRNLLVTIAAIVLIFLIVGGISFGNVDVILTGVKNVFKNADTLQGHWPGTHANEVLVLDKEGNISIYGHIETKGGQIRSWIKDGIAPIVVDSTTMVENLNAEMVGGTKANEFTLAFVTKNGNLTTEDVFLEGNAEIGKTLLVKGATKLLDSLLVQGSLGVWGDIIGQGNLKISGTGFFGSTLTTDGDISTQNHNLILGGGTIHIANKKVIYNLNADMLDSIHSKDINLDFVVNQGNETSQSIKVGGLHVTGLSEFDEMTVHNNGLWAAAGAFSGGLGVGGGFSAYGPVELVNEDANETLTVNATNFRLDSSGNVIINGTTSIGSQLTISGFPSGTEVSNASLYINPTSASADYVLFGIAVDGEEKLKLDAEGDLTLAGSLNATATASFNDLTLSSLWLKGTPEANVSPSLLMETEDIANGWPAGSATFFGINASSDFTGNFLDLQKDGSSKFSIDQDGNITGGAIAYSTASVSQDFQVGTNTFYVNVGSGSYDFGGTGTASFAGPVNINNDLNVDNGTLFVDASGNKIDFIHASGSDDLSIIDRIKGGSFYDGTMTISNGLITGAIWNGAKIDISDYTNLTTSNPISLNGDNLECDVASASGVGCLSAANWTTFNDKQGALSALAPMYIEGSNIFMELASASHNGYLSGTDWTTFNDKLGTSFTRASVSDSLTVGDIMHAGIITDGTATLTGGNWTGIGSLTTTTGLFTHASISDDLTIGTDDISFIKGVASISSTLWLGGDLTGVRASLSDSLTLTDILHAGILTDGTATLTGGVFTGLSSLTSTDGFFTHASVSDDLTIGDNITFSDSLASISSTLNLDGILTSLGTATSSFVGKLAIGTYTLPNTDGTNGQALITDGSGVVGWGAISASGIAADSLDYTEFKDAMALDNTTSVAFSNYDYIFNLTETGDFIVQDDGTSSLVVDDSGNTTLGGNLTVNGAGPHLFAGTIDPANITSFTLTGTQTLGATYYIDNNGDGYFRYLGIGTAPSSTYALNVSGKDVYFQEKTFLGTTSTYFDTSGNLEMGGGTISDATDEVDINGSLAVNSYLQVGGTDATSFSRFGTGDTDHLLSGAGDLLVSGNLEVNGLTYLDGNIIAGSISGSGASISGDFQVGTNTFYANVGSGSYDFGGTGTASFAGGLTIAGDTNFDSGTLFVDSSGNNIGLGDDSPAYTLSVDGTASISDDTYIGNNMLFADVSANTVYSSSSWSILGNFDVDGIASVSGLTSGGTATSSFAGGLTVAGDLDIQSGKLFVDQSSGNVGIGTTSPGYLLDIQGATGQAQIKATTGTNFSLLRINNTGGNFYVGRNNSVGTGLITTGGIAYSGVLNARGTYPLQFAVNDIAVMTILSGGNVGIGNTVPDQKLTVAGDILASTSYFTGGIYASSSVYFDNTASVSGGLYVDAFTSISDDFSVASSDYVSGDDYGPTIYVDTVNDYVGIGTVSPANLLTVSGASTSLNFLEIGAASISDNLYVDGIIYGNGSGISGVAANPGGSDGQIQYNNNGVMAGSAQFYYDDITNRVGIGEDSSLTYTLSVDGTASISDDFYVGNTALFVDSSAARVGIGTLTPSSLLEVSGASGSINFTTIGTASVSDDLYVDGTLYANNIFGIIDGSGNSNYLAKWQDGDTLTNSIIYDDGSTASISGSFYIDSGDDTFVVNAANNYVGIGTVSPANLLTVSGASTSLNFLEIGAASISDNLYVDGIIYGNGSGISGVAANPGGSDGQIQYNNGGVMSGTGLLYYDDVNNYFGIGTTVPSTELSIVGTASISEDLWASGSFQFGGGKTTATASYSRLGSGNTNHNLVDADDLLISGNLEIDGDLFADGAFAPAYVSASQDLEVNNGLFYVNVGSSSFQFANTATGSIAGPVNINNDLNVDNGTLFVDASGNKIDFIHASGSDDLSIIDRIKGGSFYDGTMTISNGLITGATWNGAKIDISDYTNLAATNPLSLVNDALYIDYASASGGGYLTNTDYGTIFDHVASSNAHIDWTAASSSFFTTGSLEVDNTASISGNTTISGNLTVSGAGTHAFSGTLAPTNVAAFTLTGTQTLGATYYIDNNGDGYFRYLGIGTAPSSTYALNVSGKDVYFQEKTFLGTTSTYFDTSGNLEMGGGTISDAIDEVDINGSLAVNSYLQVGGTAATSFSRFGTNPASDHSLSGADDLLISGDLEVDGSIFGDGGIVFNVASISGDFQVGTNTFYANVGSGSYQFGGTGSASFAGDLDIEGDVNIGGNDLYVDASSGRVGIGTTAPSGKLQLTTAISTSFLPAMYIENPQQSVNSGAATGIMFAAQGGTNLFKGGIAFETRDTYDRGNLYFLLDNTENQSNATLTDAVMTITNTGNVGIGNTVPDQKLTVAGDILASSSYFTSGIWASGSVSFDSTASISSNLYVQGPSLFQANTDSTTFFQIASSGYVAGDDYGPIFNVNTTNQRIGIGTATPAQKLDLFGAGSPNNYVNFKINGGSSGTSAYLSQVGTTTNLTHNAYVSSNGSAFTADITSVGASQIKLDRGYIAFNTSAATLTSPITWIEGMRIDSSGNVGIGTTSPDYALDVVGQIISSSSWTKYASISNDFETSSAQITSASFGTIRGGTWNGAKIDVSDYTNLTTTNPISLNGDNLECDVASASGVGCLSAANWTTFNDKQGALSALAPMYIEGSNIFMELASASHNGYLSGTDWSTFNNKQGAITATDPLWFNGTTLDIDFASGSAGGYILGSDFQNFFDHVASSNAHIDWTNTTSSLLTTGTGTFGHASISDDLTIGTDDISFIGGVASISNTLWLGGDLTGIRASLSDSLTATDIIRGGTLTDGTATLTGGAFTGLTSLTTTGLIANHASLSDGFEYRNGYDPSVSNYYDDAFTVNSFFESPFVSMGMARNYLLQTEVFDSTSWTKTDITAPTANTVVAPNAATTAENISAGSTDTANISQAVADTSTGYWSAGVWARAQSGTATISLRIDSSAETGTEKAISLDTNWRFYSVTQNFASANTTKTFLIISGTNAISLWGARMNPGESCNAYYARTTSSLTTATPGVFFNNTTIYGTLSGYASYAGYSSYGVYSGFSLSNASDKTDQWAYIGNMYLAYNSTYRYGQSWNIELKLREYTNNTNKAYDQLEDATLILKGYLPTVADAATFNSTVPNFSVELSGNHLVLTKDDIAMQVYSTSTSTKYIRLYVKIKDDNTHYTLLPSNRYGGSYSSTGVVTISYCYFNVAIDQTPAALPAPAQGSTVYAAYGASDSPWAYDDDSNIYNWNLTNVGINDTSPSYALSVDGTASISDDFYFGNNMLWGDVSANALYSSSSLQIVGNFDVDGTASVSALIVNGANVLTASISDSLTVGDILHAGIITDGTATLTGGNFTGLTSLTSTLGTFTHASISDDLTIGSDDISFVGGVASISSTLWLGGDLTGIRASLSDSLTLTDILHAGILTDGTATLTGGNWTGIGSLTATTGLFTHASISDDFETSSAQITSASFGTIRGGTWNGAKIDVSDYTNLTTTNPISLNGDNLECDVASASGVGCLSAANWTTFNGKQDTLSATAPIYIEGTTVLVELASASHNGYLLGTDWSTFNNKLDQKASSDFVWLPTTTTNAFELNGLASISGIATFYNNIIASGSLNVDNVASISGTITAGNLISCDTIDTSSTGLLSCGTDDDIPEAADYSALTGGEGIDNSPTGTLLLDLTEYYNPIFASGSATLWTIDAGTTDPLLWWENGALTLGSSSFTVDGLASISGTITLSNLVSCDTIDSSATGLLSCGTDDDIPEAADYSALTGGEGVDNSPTGTILLDLTEYSNPIFASGSAQTWTIDAGAVDPLFIFNSGAFTLGSATFESDYTASLSSNWDFNSAGLVQNIGNAGTDFTTGGGLTLAGTFTRNGAELASGSLNLVGTNFMIDATASISGNLNVDGTLTAGTFSADGIYASDSLDFDEFIDNATLDNNWVVDDNGNGYYVSFPHVSASDDLSVTNRIKGGSFYDGTLTISGGDISGGDEFSFNYGSMSQDFQVGTNTFYLNVGSSSFQFGNTATGSIAGPLTVGGDFDADSGTLFVDSSTNRVGVGITNPATALDINGELKIGTLNAGSTNTVLIHSSNVVQQRTIDSRVWGSSLSDGSGDTNYVAIWSDANTLTYDNNYFYYNPSTHRLGIGDSSPAYTLSVDGTASISDDFYIGDTLLFADVSLASISVGGGLEITGDLSVDSGTFWLDSSSNYIEMGAAGTDVYIGQSGSPVNLIIEDTGKIGIGDTSPTYSLSVDGTASISDDFYIGNNMIFADVSANTIYSSSSWSILGNFDIDGITSMSNNLYVNGKIGIASTSPDEVLSVKGNINFTGKLLEDGNEIFSGVIAMFDTACPTGWTSFSALNSTFPRGATTYGGTGGDATHIHSVNPPATNTGSDAEGGYYAAGSGGSAIPRTAHYHSVDIAAFDSVATSSLPPYLDMVFCKKNAGADIAEWTSSKEQYESGTLVVLDPDANERLLKSNKAYDLTVVGVISTQPGWIVGTQSANAQMLTLTGRVPAKVSLINGPIKIGDPITTSSIPGTGMKATQPGAIVGKAMANFDELSAGTDCVDPATQTTTKCGEITIFINVSWFGGNFSSDGTIDQSPTTAEAQTTASVSASQTTEITQVVDEFVENLINGLKGLGIEIGNGIIKVANLVASKIFAEEIIVENNVYSKGEISSEKDVSTKGAFKRIITINKNEVEASPPTNEAGDANTKLEVYSLPGSDSITRLPISEDETGFITYSQQTAKPEISVSGTNQLQGGEARIIFDPSFRAVIFHSSTNEPSYKVIVTPTSATKSGLYVAEKDENGFLVRSTNQTDLDTTFDWLVIANLKGQNESTTQIPFVETPTPDESSTTESIPTSEGVPDASIGTGGTPTESVKADTSTPNAPETTAAESSTTETSAPIDEPVSSASETN